MMIEISTGPALAEALRKEGIDIIGLDRPGHVSLSNVKIEAPISCLSALRMSTGRVEIGAYTHLNGGGIICACTIGRYCSIAPDVVIGQPEHPINHLTFSPLAWGEDFNGWASYNKSKGRPRRLPVAVVQGTRKHTTVGNDVWIGQGAMLKAGVKVGDGAIVGAGAVVTRNVEPYTIVGGLPAKIIRKRFDDTTIARLLKLKWWEYDLLSAEGLDTTDIVKALDRFEQLVAEAKIPKLAPRVFTNDDFAAMAAEAQKPPAVKV